MDQLTDVGEAFDAWTEVQRRPWVEDHAVMDQSLRRRWVGDDIDLSGPRLPSDLVLEAARVDERITPAIGRYVAMEALPAVLDPVEPLARAVYETGWRPRLADGLVAASWSRSWSAPPRSRRGTGSPPS